MDKKSRDENGKKKAPTKDDDRWSKIKKKSKVGDDNGAKKSPARDLSRLDIYLKNRPGPRLRQIYADMPGVAGPSQRPAVNPSASGSRHHRQAYAITEEEDESRLPVVTEGALLYTSGDDFKNVMMGGNMVKLISKHRMTMRWIFKEKQ